MVSATKLEETSITELLSCTIVAISLLMAVGVGGSVLNCSNAVVASAVLSKGSVTAVEDSTSDKAVVDVSGTVVATSDVAMTVVSKQSEDSFTTLHSY